MDLQLTGKRALVLGSSKGLGRGAAEALAAEGAHIAINGRSADAVRAAAEEIRQTYSVPVHPLVGDVGVAVDCQRLVDEAAAALGGLDILVTNSGGPAPGTFASTTADQWQQGVENTLLSVMHLARAALPHLRRAGGGRIVNIVSTSVKQPIPGLLLSNALRPGVIGLAKTLADELGPENILVNNVLPGAHDTDRIVELLEKRAAANQTSIDEERDKMTAATPLRRMGQPAELGSLVAFLCSARASFITGTSIPIDGGALRTLL